MPVWIEIVDTELHPDGNAVVITMRVSRLLAWWHWLTRCPCRATPIGECRSLPPIRPGRHRAF